jgi:hypothetical protein
MRKTSLAVLLLAAMAGPALRSDAEVVGLDIEKRAGVGASGCDKIIGTIHFAVDPIEPHKWPWQH